MKFTTHFALHSQAMRLFESHPYCAEDRVVDGTLTLYDALFQRTYTRYRTG